jgi:hypothetical protein
MTAPDPDGDDLVARAASTGSFDVALVGMVVLILTWPVVKVWRALRRRRA